MINIHLLDQPQLDIRYTDVLAALDQRMREKDAAPYLYPKTKDFYRQCLAGECYNILALNDEEVIGYAALRRMSPWPAYLEKAEYPESECALMLHNMVDPSWRGQGIAKLLNQGRITLARGQGLRYLFSTVHPENTPSIKSLKRSGFRVLDQRKMFSEQLLRNLMFLDLNEQQ